MEQLIHRVEEWVRQQPIEQIYVAFAVLMFTISFFGLCKSTLPCFYLFLFLVHIWVRKYILPYFYDFHVLY